MKKYILDTIDKLDAKLSPGGKLMVLVGSYIVGILIASLAIAYWPSVSEYAWISLSSPILLWLGIGFMLLTFTGAVLWLMLGRESRRNNK